MKTSQWNSSLRQWAILGILTWATLGAAAQEDAKRDSLRTATGMEDMQARPAERTAGTDLTVTADSPLPGAMASETDTMARLSLTSVPLLIPYYMNPSPLLRGDYSTGGIMGAWRHGTLYGAGSQETLPGIGRMNTASVAYMHRLGERWSLHAGVNALKANMPFATGQAVGLSGGLTYQATERLAFNVFGSYYQGRTYGGASHGYGGSVTMGLTDRFSLEAGIQRRYNPLRGTWETVPIAVPSYRFDKFSLGIDVGGILYELLHKVVIDRGGHPGNPTLAPAAAFEGAGRR